MTHHTVVWVTLILGKNTVSYAHICSERVGYADPGESKHKDRGAMREDFDFAMTKPKHPSCPSVKPLQQRSETGYSKYRPLEVRLYHVDLNA